MDQELALDPNWSRRRRNRANAFRFLFQWELNRPDDLAEAMSTFFGQLDEPRDAYAYAEEVVQGVIKNQEKIDGRITELVDNWEFDRIAKTDLALLRVAVFEMLHRLDVPPVVVIDEALELAKAFSTERSRSFLNGVLDRVCQDLDRPAREAAVD